MLARSVALPVVLVGHRCSRPAPARSARPLRDNGEQPFRRRTSRHHRRDPPQRRLLVGELPQRLPRLDTRNCGCEQLSEPLQALIRCRGAAARSTKPSLRPRDAHHDDRLATVDTPKRGPPWRAVRRPTTSRSRQRGRIVLCDTTCVEAIELIELTAGSDGDPRIVFPIRRPHGRTVPLESDHSGIVSKRRPTSSLTAAKISAGVDSLRDKCRDPPQGRLFVGNQRELSLRPADLLGVDAMRQWSARHDGLAERLSAAPRSWVAFARVESTVDLPV